MLKRLSATQLGIIWFLSVAFLAVFFADRAWLNGAVFLLMGILCFLRPTLILEGIQEVSQWKMNKRSMEIHYPNGFTSVFSEKYHRRFGIINGIIWTSVGLSDILFHWLSRIRF